jgi:hypothetical protein
MCTLVMGQMGVAGHLTHRKVESTVKAFELPMRNP